jgi:hypothetical protein
VRRRTRKLLDHWEAVMENAKERTARRTYSEYERTLSPFLHTPLGEATLGEDDPESHFVAPTSLRDVEPSSPLWLPSNKKKEPDGALPTTRKTRGRDPAKPDRNHVRRRRHG